jgi:hypothetical protein
MTSKRKDKIKEKDLQGFKHFKLLLPILEKLHDSGCERDRAHQRKLHFDQYCALMLLYMFNPVVTSLRAIQQASELKKVQKKLSCARSSLGSLSESSHVFNPDLLEPILGELAEQLQPIHRDSRLGDIKQILTLVDGTLLKALPRIAAAMWLDEKHRAFKLHTHFEFDKYVPVRMDLTDGANTGPSDEKQVLRQTLLPDRCYVMDRGYAQFTLFNDILAAGSSYVCRVRDNSVFDIQQERKLSSEAVEAGVACDAVVKMGIHSKSSTRPNHLIRLVIVKTELHDKRSNRKGNTGSGPSDRMLRIATNLMDVPAEIIALIYHYRWTIEVFFRFFKHVLGCRHLVSDHPNGIRIQTYCAIIACMLISLWTGRKPTLRTYEMICYYFSGLADEEELVAHIRKLKPHEEK